MKLLLALIMTLTTTWGMAYEAESITEPSSIASVEDESADSMGKSTPASMEESSPLKAVSEEQIPVNINAVKKADNSESYLGRLVTVVAVMILIGGGALFFAKKFGRPGQSQQAQIKILTQYYIGPKKSLAIVRVAGESMLVGITDHSINLIKSLSLLDDEIPETTQPHFENVMQDQEKVQQIGGEEFSIRHIKDVVSLKLKGMRNDL